MYSDRQKELSVFLRQLQQSAEEKTGERVTNIKQLDKDLYCRILYLMLR